MNQNAGNYDFGEMKDGLMNTCQIEVSTFTNSVLIFRKDKGRYLMIERNTLKAVQSRQA